MGKLTVAQTIKEITRHHLEQADGLLLGQNVSAVGWVNGTVPDTRNIVELPMTDVAGAGFAVGAALTGRRTILVIRFQDFMTLNGSPIINYAAKCNTLHGYHAPLWIRAIGTDKLGPVHSSVLHSIFMHFPGMEVCSPMTPGEYRQCWETYLDHDNPFYVSEHRDSYSLTEELPNQVQPRADVTIFAISATRLNLSAVIEVLDRRGIRANVFHIVWLKPFRVEPVYLEALAGSRCGLVVDAGYEICGASQSMAHTLTLASGVSVHALGLRDETKCLCEPYQNPIPDAAAIVAKVQDLVAAKDT